MKMKNVVCAIDFSDQSQRVLALASSLAKESGATLHIVHSYEEPFAYDPQLVEYVQPPDVERERARLAELSVPDPSVTVQREFIVGEPSTAIQDYAAKCRADMIVMGTHGRTGVARLLMGSVAENVLRHASCPVLIVKQPQAPDVP